MDKITVAVCGDSFCAASVDDLQITGTGYRAHFSQMLEDQYGYSIMYMAHGGFSNAGILWQIRESVNRCADVVVYNRTWSNRIELNVRDKFTIESGLHNFFYYDPSYQSSAQTWAGDNDASIISTSNWNLASSPFFKITREQTQAVDLYLKYLYNDTMATEMDRWMFEYWHQRMLEQKILPIDFQQPTVGKIAYEFSQSNRNYDTPFHTDRATQEQIAGNIHKYIVDNLQQIQ